MAPTTMKAAVLHQNGDPSTKEVLTVESDVPVLEPRPGQVLVKVSAASINPIDCLLMKGNFPGNSKGGVGMDLSGTVEKIGPDTSTDIKVGDAIYADAIQTIKASGTWAEYALVEAVAASPKPKNIDFVEAASLPLVGLTALQCLTTHGQMKQGSKILILGGTSAVGSLAIQMAKTLGASEVTATGSSVDVIKSFGADHVVNYREQDIMEELKGKDFDLVFDTIGGYDHWLVGQAALKKGGIYVTIAADGHGVSFPMIVASTVWRKLMSYFGGPAYIFAICDATAPAVVKDMQKITELVEAGKVKPYLDERKFELTTESVHELVKASMSGRAKGKLVLKINC